MKSVFCLLVSLSIGLHSNAQFLQNVFNQKTEHKKNQLKQIALLQVYIGYLEKGYGIAKKGLTFIGDIKQGHFSLDKDFFASLAAINPKVKNYARVGDIISVNISMAKQGEKLMEQVKQTHVFSKEENDYMETTCNSIIKDAATITGELIDVLTANLFTMSEDERIACIDKLYEDIVKRQSAMSAFVSSVRVMGVQKAREAAETKELRQLYK